MIRYEMTAVTRRWMVAGLGLVALPACTFDARNQGAITEPGLEDQRAVVALVQGVVGDYDFAFQRSSLFSGLISDEVRSSGTYTSWRAADVDGVVDANSATTGVQNISAEWWVRLHRARVLAEVAYDRVDGSLVGQQRASLMALSRVYSGMSYRDIGEYFCSAAYDAGPEVARAQSLERARTHLTESIALAGEAGVDSVATLARLIRGQVNYSLGDLDAALADVRSVPKGFKWNAHYRDGAYEANETYVYMNEQALATVESGFSATGDPRVPVKANGKGADKVTARFDQQKFTAHTNIGLAKWQEARLIEAEILLARGQVSSAVALMNEVRTAAGLAALSSTLTAAQAEAALRTERKHELFMEGQRMLDMRRWGLFPQGWQATCVPIPASELATNPNI
jgi:hypothetical protein